MVILLFMVEDLIFNFHFRVTPREVAYSLAGAVENCFLLLSFVSCEICREKFVGLSIVVV